MRRMIGLVAVALVAATPTAAQQGSSSEALLTAVKEGDANKVVQLSEGEAAGMINIRGFDGTTPLTAAVKNRNMPFVSYLLSKKADPSLATRDGQTPLIIATHLNWEEAVDLLLRVGAKVDGTDRQGQTALIIAVQNRNTRLVRRLLQSGANPDKADHAAGYSARDYAKRDNRVRELLRLIETAKPAAR
ncbi:ankyrin repeat domain-containing protein [Sphingomonas rhizophila]|uniref:Ankyrin repeat domain-containing protein n=1 Tax=Sphingomonas rhizophila TaxID=2071607 RepID=A0A7G9SAK7_9SPHN|nr:ankyrin repeat domain-containing protein [Sphingomonas rhizophila]QNN64882.1 ankyrin repeat domain-containing protein [Sphingomonas rhizophila]